MRLTMPTLPRRLRLPWIILANLVAFLIGWSCAVLTSGSLPELRVAVGTWGLLSLGAVLGSVYMWSARYEPGTFSAGTERVLPAVRARLGALLSVVPDHRMLGIVLGPAVGLLVWWLPLGLEPVAHRALAIVGVMLVYWITDAKPAIEAARNLLLQFLGANDCIPLSCTGRKSIGGEMEQQGGEPEPVFRPRLPRNCSQGGIGGTQKR